MKNKKGVEILSGTLVIIVLAIIVLVILALGFGTGWKNFWGKMTAFGGGGDDVQTAIDACQIACAKQSTYDFCKKQRSVKINDAVKKYGCVKLYSDNGMGNCENLCAGVEGVFTEEVAQPPSPPVA